MGSKALSLVLLDVGPLMKEVLPYATKAVSTFILSKILYKKSDQAALVFFGTTGTDNPVNAEVGDYEHVTVEQAMRPPDRSFLISLSVAQCGQGRSDFLDALVVGVDLMYKAMEASPLLEKANIAKRIILVSNFLARPTDDDDGVIVPALVERMQERALALEVVRVDDAAADAAHVSGKAFSMGLIEALRARAHSELRVMANPADLLGAFKVKAVAATAYFSGPMSLGTMNIRVKVTKKTRRETFPALGLYSERSLAPDATHAVAPEREYRSVANPDQVVPPQHMVKAYKYGRNKVPVTKEVEAELKYAPERGLAVCGFLDDAEVQHHHFVKDPWLVAPEKGNERAGMALSALARALHRRHKLALVRFVPRANSEVTMCVAIPQLGAPGNSQPDCLLLNHLPFAEDVRAAAFASLSCDAKLVPSLAQVGDARALVAAMSLGSGEGELLRPETTANPAIQRFLGHVAAAAVDPEVRIGPADDDPLVRRVLQPRLDAMPAAAAPAMHLRDAFPMTIPKQHIIRTRQGALRAGAGQGRKSWRPGGEGLEAADGAGGVGYPEEPEEDAPAFSLSAAPASRVTAVTTATPVEDFRALLAQGQADAAFEGLASIVGSLVASSIGDRLALAPRSFGLHLPPCLSLSPGPRQGQRAYGKALACVAALREEAQHRHRAPAFNMALRGWAAQFEADSARSAFWRLVVDAGHTLLPAPDVTPADAAAFLQEHSATGTKEVATQQEADLLDDEFEDMA